MRIARKFKQLTRYTYPYGTEQGLLPYLPEGYKEDGLGNYYLEIGDKPSTMFACHLDTACSKKERVIHVQKSANIIGTDGTTILGADDKAGMVVILYMIENKVPGLYYFFEGEEVGCIGSGKVADAWDSMFFSDYIKKVVSFDRRGTDSIITDQFYGRCCSDEFGNDLAEKLNSTGLGFNFDLDPTGIFTDSAKFMELVPECTNISVGYYDEHTKYETQDIEFLQRLCKGVCMIDWESLPIKRDHTEDPYQGYFSSYGSRNVSVEDFVGEDLSWSEYNYSYFDRKGASVKLYISSKYIEYEINIIDAWISGSDMYPGEKNIIWNGNSLYIQGDYVGDRIDLCDFISELSTVPEKHLSSFHSVYS